MQHVGSSCCFQRELTVASIDRIKQISFFILEISVNWAPERAHNRFNRQNQKNFLYIYILEISVNCSPNCHLLYSVSFMILRSSIYRQMFYISSSLQEYNMCNFIFTYLLNPSILNVVNDLNVTKIIDNYIQTEYFSFIISLWNVLEKHMFSWFINIIIW